ncbi:hypothetical protein F0L74_09705 [Chitinophaga agrisoli]|uniref:Uncharacterized protein n=1 Tax=Chitinophaga agrisoli TaxID=2607653 RepID=A0A5B2VSN6_9BACT|nr:hypothetical protein [Chitinophaga agrisoli]KAA2242793.1 hypothetical protein F0L74_09705 [Chitinophaga agrisoli]
MLQSCRDSLAAANYAFDLARQDANEQAKRADKAEAQLSEKKEDAGHWQRAAIITWIAVAGVIGAGVVLKLKSII